MSERREYPRAKGPFEGWWDGAGRQGGRVTDLSVGGCFVESVTLPAVGQVVIVWLSIGAGQIQVPGEVMYCEANHGFAVRFVEVPHAILEIVSLEVERRLQS